MPQNPEDPRQGPRPRGRAVPDAEPIPMIIGAPAKPTATYTHVLDDDSIFFRDHPGVTERWRAYIPGEDPNSDWPPGTKVLVGRLSGNRRARAFCPPSVEGN